MIDHHASLYYWDGDCWQFHGAYYSERDLRQAYCALLAEYGAIWMESQMDANLRHALSFSRDYLMSSEKVAREKRDSCRKLNLPDHYWQGRYHGLQVAVIEIERLCELAGLPSKLEASQDEN